MKSEFHSVVNEFQRLLNEHNPKCLKKSWCDDLICLNKHVIDIYYCYIIARAYRHNGSLEVTMWVGVIDRPDDGLGDLLANIKIQIGYNQTCDEAFFKECGSKIVNITESGSLANLINASQIEMRIPPFHNGQYKVFTLYLAPFYKMVLEQTNYDKKILNSKENCRAITENIFGNSLSGEVKIFFGKPGLDPTTDMI